MVDRPALEVNIEMELDSDVETKPERPLPICAICEKGDTHEHDECAKKYCSVDRSYYDDDGGFIESTPPDHFVKEAQRLYQDPGPEGQHYRALQAYKQNASKVEEYLTLKRQKYGENAKGNGAEKIPVLDIQITILLRSLSMDVFSLRAYQQQCRVQGPEKHYCPCGCGKQVIPGTSLIIEVIKHAASKDSEPEEEEFHIHWNGDDAQEYEDDEPRDDTPGPGTLNSGLSHDKEFEEDICVEEITQQTQKPSQHDHDHDHLQSNMPNHEHDIASVQNGTPSDPEGGVVPVVQSTKRSTRENAI